jgi:hypothetical protein
VNRFREALIGGADCVIYSHHQPVTSKTAALSWTSRSPL